MPSSFFINISPSYRKSIYWEHKRKKNEFPIMEDVRNPAGGLFFFAHQRGERQFIFLIDANCSVPGSRTHIVEVGKYVEEKKY